jgi:hypothetical protein
VDVRPRDDGADQAVGERRAVDPRQALDVDDAGAEGPGEPGKRDCHAGAGGDHREGPDAPQDASTAAPPPQEPAPSPIEAAPAVVAVESPAPVDTTGTRWAPRVEIAETVELMVDGGAGKLIDLSTSGAQIVSPASLKPNQKVRLTFPGSVQMRVNAAVAWVIFEMPQGAPRYRAGVAFADANPAEIQRFMNANKKD